MIVSDAGENYMFLTDSQMVGLLYGEEAKNCMCFHIPYRCKVNHRVRSSGSALSPNYPSTNG